MSVYSGSEMEIWRPGRGAGSEGGCRFVEGLVACAFGIGVPALRSSERGSASAAFARQAAMYLAHVNLGLNLSEVGASFRRDRTTVAHACAKIEDARDDPRMERILACLEAALVQWRDSFCGAAE